MIVAAVRFLCTRGAYVLAVGVFAGLAMPGLAAWLRPLLPVAVAGLLFLALLRIDWGELGQHVSRPLLNSVLCLWFLGLSPLLVWLAVGALGVGPGLATPLVLMAACPPIMSGPAIALLLRLDAPMMLVTMVLAALAAPFTVAAVSSALTGVELAIEPLRLFLRLASLVGGCLLAALLVRRAAGRARLDRMRLALDGTSVLMLLLFAVAIMDGVASRLGRDPALVLLFVLGAFGANLALQLLGALAAAPLGLRPALTVGFATGNRNMGLLLAVLPASTAPDTLLFFALAQFPIYMLPALLAKLYRAVLRAESPTAA